MTNTSSIDQGHTQRPKRSASDKPAGGGSKSSFNPLHPSMELPPEQLIRLLGLEDKKSRKKRKSPASTKSSPPVVHERTEKVYDQHPQATAIERPVPPPRAAKRRSRPTSQRRSRERADTSLFGDQRRGWLRSAMGFGLVAGIALSIYLFWGQSAPQKKVVQAAKVEKPVAPSQSSPVAGKPAQAVKANTPAATVTEKKNSAADDNPKWRAAIKAQEQRLRAAAQQRMNEREKQASHPVTAETDASMVVTKPDTFIETPAAAPVEPTPPISDEITYQAPEEAPQTNTPEQPVLPTDDKTPLVATPTQSSPDTGAAPVLPDDAGLSETVIPTQPVADGSAPEAAPAEPLPVPTTEADGNAEPSPENLSAAETMTTRPAMAEPLADDSASGETAGESEVTSIPAQPGYAETPDLVADDAGTGD